MYPLHEVLIIMLLAVICGAASICKGRNESRASKDNSAENFNVVRRIALNILKSEKALKAVLPINSLYACLITLTSTKL